MLPQSFVLTSEEVNWKEAFLGSVVGVVAATLAGAAGSDGLCDQDAAAASVVLIAGLAGGIGGPFLFSWIWDDKEADSAKEIRAGLAPIDGGAGAQVVLRF